MSRAAPDDLKFFEAVEEVVVLVVDEVEEVDDVVAEPA